MFLPVVSAPTTSDVSVTVKSEQNVEQGLAEGANVMNLVTDVAASNDSKESTPSPVSDADPFTQHSAGAEAYGKADIIHVTICMLPTSQFIPRGKVTLPTQTKVQPLPPPKPKP